MRGSESALAAAMTAGSSIPPVLLREARLFSRYLGGRAAPPDLLARYTDAIASLGLDAPAGADARLLAWARAGRPFIGLLDAGCAVLRPRGNLRRRLLVMTAVLEASPDYADRFIPLGGSRLAQTATLALAGTIAAAKLALGWPLVRILGGRP